MQDADETCIFVSSSDLRIKEEFGYREIAI